MKMLYISSTHSGMRSRSIYFDLMQEFVRNGHEVYVAYALEKRLNEETRFFEENGIKYLGVKTGNISKNKNLIEKGIAILTFDGQMKRALKDNLSDIQFDLVLYSTPPITLLKSIRFLRKTSPNALLYLMLKDIFPQNAVDLGMFSSGGVLHYFFRRKEKTLYQLSDRIGVMSLANQKYLLDRFPYLKPKVEILPNTIGERENLTEYSREDFGLDANRLLMLFGGNLGKPQAVDYLLECAKRIEGSSDMMIVVAGSGSMEALVEDYAKKNSETFKYFGQLDSDRYEGLTNVCDVGLIFLDYRFTIPNYPQRVLSYLTASKPIITATDPITDVGSDAVSNNYGLSVASNDVEAWLKAANYMKENPTERLKMGENGFRYYKSHFTPKVAYSIIIKHMEVQDV